MTEFRATYRLQLTPEFGFRAARALVPYLRDLGISHLYLSPSLQARHGSMHGYDVTDPTHVSEDLGGEHAFGALCAAARDAGLAWDREPVKLRPAPKLVALIKKSRALAAADATDV